MRTATLDLGIILTSMNSVYATQYRQSWTCWTNTGRDVASRGRHLSFPRLRTLRDALRCCSRIFTAPATTGRVVTPSVASDPCMRPARHGSIPSAARTIFKRGWWICTQGQQATKARHVSFIDQLQTLTSWNWTYNFYDCTSCSLTLRPRLHQHARAHSIRLVILLRATPVRARNVVRACLVKCGEAPLKFSAAPCLVPLPDVP